MNRSPFIAIEQGGTAMGDLSTYLLIGAPGKVRLRAVAPSRTTKRKRSMGARRSRFSVRLAVHVSPHKSTRRNPRAARRLSKSRPRKRPFLRRAASLNLHPLSLPMGARTSVILTIQGPAGNLESVLKQLQRLLVKEILVVVDDPFHPALPLLLAHPLEPLVLCYPEPLGPGVARALGAQAAAGDILLYADAHVLLPAEQLIPYLYAVASGIDLALLDSTSVLPPFAGWDSATTAQSFLNRLLGRGDLRTNSLRSLPHAISRRVPETVGYPALAIPPLAQALALEAGLSASLVGTGRMGAIAGEGSPFPLEVTLGDHLEALHELMARKGPRFSYFDHLRKRDAKGDEA
ncbi:hypothetical protein [Gorillibacterium sp. CAU 1737]|uniref:hypothetical protein n=1 Tax=Gorillibacterium sp. CAU 1737 TaxID=3140362 RepID=UPI00326075F0